MKKVPHSEAGCPANASGDGRLDVENVEPARSAILGIAPAKTGARRVPVFHRRLPCGRQSTATAAPVRRAARGTFVPFWCDTCPSLIPPSWGCGLRPAPAPGSRFSASLSEEMLFIFLICVICVICAVHVRVGPIAGTSRIPKIFIGCKDKNSKSQLQQPG